MMQVTTNKFGHIVQVLAVAIILLSFSGCAITNATIDGTYSAVTDFSRDLYTMSGKKETVLYKNGRKETIKFTPQHKFVKKVQYTSDRVEDKIRQGHWKIINLKIIEVSFEKNHPKEYYKHVSKSQIIRLDANKNELDGRYAPYFTYERNSTEKHLKGHFEK